MNPRRTADTRRIGRRLLPALLVCGLLVCGLLAAPTGAAAAPALQVTVEGDRLTAELGAVPIADVLNAVAEQTGARLSIRGELGNARPQAFTSVPLADALPRLAQPNGLILEFAPRSGDERRLVAIRAVAPGGGASAGAGGPQVGRLDPRSRTIPGLWNYEKGDEVLPPIEDRIARLGKIAAARGEASAAAVIYVLTADPENAVRLSALGLLAGMRGPDARQAMMQAAADADPEMRINALKSLARGGGGGGGGKKPVTLLAQAAKGDGEPMVRMTALELLSASKDGEMARAVLQGALSDPDPQVREAAQSALRR